MSSSVDAARTLMADSLGFHIIFALLGVGLPVVILLLEYMGLKRRSPQLLEHARRLSLAAVVLVVAGVASGTIISIQMSLMWGNLIKFGGQIMGLAFGWEGYAFMLEAVFLAFYVASWGKVKGWAHWWIGWPLVVGSTGSALAITVGNAWMQNPGKLTIVNGHVVNHNPLGALLTKTALLMDVHSVVAYYLATLLIVLGAYAFYYLRKKPQNKSAVEAREIMFVLALASLAMVVLVAVTGDLQTRYLSKSEPRKFAALESVQNTGSHQPYIIGGHFNPGGQVVGGIHIKNGLSLITGFSANTRITGLDSFAKKDWPMLFINTLFESKMVLVFFITIIPAIFVALHWRKLGEKLRSLRYSKPLLLALLPLGLFAVVDVELGWMIAEFGRQPYAVNGYLLTSQAFSASHSVIQWGYLFPTLYLGLFIATGLALRILLKRLGALKPAKGLL